MNAIAEEFIKYEDSGGLIAPTIGGGSLNGVTYTSIAMIVLQDNNALDENLRQYWIGKLYQCFLEPGLLTRTPDHNKDQEGPDDYLAICAASHICNMEYAKDILHYGLDHFFVYNNDGKLKLGDWLGRQLQLVAHIWYCAIGFCPPFLGIASAISIFVASFSEKTDQDAWMLSWLLGRCVPKYNFLAQLAIWWWKKKMYSHFPNGLKDLNYLNGNNEHPITRHWIK